MDKARELAHKTVYCFYSGSSKKGHSKACNALTAEIQAYVENERHEWQVMAAGADHRAEAAEAKLAGAQTGFRFIADEDRIDATSLQLLEKLELIERRADTALAELREAAPPCSVCGGSGKVGAENDWGDTATVTCPPPPEGCGGKRHE